MSKNAKTVRKLKVAKDYSAQRKGGGKGPSATTPKHGKKNAWWQRGKSNKPKVEEATT